MYISTLASLLAYVFSAGESQFGASTISDACICAWEHAAHVASRCKEKIEAKNLLNLLTSSTTVTTDALLSLTGHIAADDTLAPTAILSYFA